MDMDQSSPFCKGLHLMCRCWKFCKPHLQDDNFCGLWIDIFLLLIISGIFHFISSSSFWKPWRRILLNNLFSFVFSSLHHSTKKKMWKPKWYTQCKDCMAHLTLCTTCIIKLPQQLSFIVNWTNLGRSGRYWIIMVISSEISFYRPTQHNIPISCLILKNRPLCFKTIFFASTDYVLQSFFSAQALRFIAYMLYMYIVQRPTM